MSFIKKLLRNVCYGNIDKKFYKENKEKLDEMNYNAVFVMYIAATFFEWVLFHLTLHNSFIGEFRYVFLVSSVLSFVGVLFVAKYLRKHKRYVTIAYEIISVILFLDTMIMGIYNTPSMPAVSVFIMLIVVPTLVIDKPIKSMVQCLIFTIIFDTLVLIEKKNYADTMEVDLMNSIITLFIACVFIWYVRNLHISNIQAKLQFQALAELDSLTGTYNKGYAENLCEKYFAKLGEQMDCGLMILDVDDFKSINDTYGHQQGDEVLRLVGEALHRTFHNEEIIGRVGGDEFIVFGMDQEKREMKRKANILLKSIREIAKKIDIKSLSCSIGICMNDKEGQTFKEMYIRADQTLYQAKKNGKGKVDIAE